MAIDVSKLRKSLDKMGSVSTTLSEPNFWLSTGNYALNKIMSGKFNAGIPNKRSLMLSGEQGTGKSFLCGNFAKAAQDQGYYVVYIDTEDAIDSNFLTKIGVSLDEDKFLPIRISSLEDAAKVFADLFKTVGDDDKVFVIVDSLTMLSSEEELSAFTKTGEMKNDMGLKSKKAKQLLRNINVSLAEKDMYVVYTNHVYVNQDIRNGKGTHIISGGEAPLYIPSISLLLKKKKLKEGTEITGINIIASVHKSRFSKFGASAELKVPYDTGLDPLSGLLDKLEEEKYVTKNAAWYSYEKDGKIVKFQSSSLSEHLHNIIDLNNESMDDVKEDFSEEEND